MDVILPIPKSTGEHQLMLILGTPNMNNIWFGDEHEFTLNFGVNQG